ncbi:MAG: hypothetical protein ACK42I_01295 [Thermomicrobium sp.]
MRWDPPAFDFDREAWDAIQARGLHAHRWSRAVADQQGRRRNPAGRRPVSLEDARQAWEPVVCPQCGRRHADTRTVRLRRTGRTVEARCAACGTITAVYADGVWS